MTVKALPLRVMLFKGYSPDAHFWADCDETVIRQIAATYEECWRFELLDRPFKARRDRLAKIEAKIEELLG